MIYAQIDRAADDVDLAEIREVGALLVLASRLDPLTADCAAYIRRAYGPRELARALAREGLASGPRRLEPPTITPPPSARSVPEIPRCD